MNKEKRLSVVCQEWLESERGWGCRPDGASLHLNEAARKAYVKDYWDSMPDEVPDEYSRPDGSPVLVDVDKKTYDRVVKSKNGVRLWQTEYSALRKSLE